MQGCQATGKSSKSQAGRARTVLRGTSCPQRRPVDQPPHPEGSHTTVVPFYPAPLLTSLVFLSTPPWPDTKAEVDLLKGAGVKHDVLAACLLREVGVYLDVFVP